MTHKVFTVYDSKAESFLTPFHMRNRGEAIRAFTESVNDPKTSFNRWPSDFTLFEIGEFDETKGTYKLYEAKTELGLAIQFIRETKKEINQIDMPFVKPLKTAPKEIHS